MAEAYVYTQFVIITNITLKIEKLRKKKKGLRIPLT